jgi:hypothetical protein
MTDKILSVGDRVDARCTKCRKLLNHTIVAMVDGRPARVMCNTCGGEHNYKDPSAAPQAKTSASTVKKTSRTKASPGVKAERQQWDNILADMDPSTAVHYAMDGCFRVGTLIDHPVFGLGMVQETLCPDKMRVLFQDGKKTLRCAPSGHNQR